MTRLEQRLRGIETVQLRYPIVALTSVSQEIARGEFMLFLLKLEVL